jgi:hypothetical protein
VVFELELPLTTRGTSARRRAAYVSPGTESVAISVNGGTPQVFSATTAGGPIAGCSAPVVRTNTQPITTCSWTLQVPPGPATFSVTLYSGLNGTGSVLSKGSTSATIAMGQANDVAVTFNGVPAALVLQLGSAAPPAGIASAISVVVYVVDAAGYAIIGPGSATNATLTDTDTTTTTYLYAPASTSACGTPPGGTTKSLAVSTGVFVNACLAYDGASTPSTITLNATASGLKEATAAMSPSGAQATSAAVWALTRKVPPILLAYDENATTNVAPLVRITGSSTQIPTITQTTAVGLAADANGDISIAEQHSITTFAPGSNGNVPPSSVTTFASAIGSLSGLVYDANGNVYFAGLGGSAAACTLYRATIINGSETPTAIGDCSQPVKNVSFSEQSVGGLAFDSKGDLLVGFVGFPAGAVGTVQLVVRYVPSGASYVPSGAINVTAYTPPSYAQENPPVPSLDAAGDITTYPNTYPGTSFVDDAVQLPPAIAYRGVWAEGFAQWAPNGSLFVLEYQAQQDTPAYLNRYTSASKTVEPSPVASIGSPDLNFAVAEAVGPATTSGGAPLTVRPASLSFNGAGASDTATETVSETGSTGAITQLNSCSGIATVSPSSAAAPATFTVTATGPGSCTITYADAHSDTVTSNVVVTTTTLSGQASRGR